MEVFIHRWPRGEIAKDFDSIHELEKYLAGREPLIDDEEVTVEITTSWGEIKGLLELPEMDAIWKMTGHFPVTASLIIEVAASTFDLSVSDLIRRTRQMGIVLARQIAMYLIRQETDLTLDQIGKELGGRCPATISHGYQRIVRAREAGLDLSRKVLEVQRNMRISARRRARG